MFRCVSESYCQITLEQKIYLLRNTVTGVKHDVLGKDGLGGVQIMRCTYVDGRKNAEP